MVYDHKALHKMNPEFLDEYIDEDDPGFDTYVVNEENFVASCQELAKLNDFPVRSIAPDTKHDMAHRERYRKALEAKKKSERQQTRTDSMARKLKNSDSALLMQELTRKKKQQRGEDVDEASELEALRQKSKQETEKAKESEEEANSSVLPHWVKFPVSNDQFYPAEFDKIIYDCYNLRVVFDREKTGFEGY